MKKYIKHRGKWRLVPLVRQHGKSVPNTILTEGKPTHSKGPGRTAAVFRYSLEHPAQAEEEAIVSGVACGAADQDRAKDCIDDEPGGHVGRIAVLGRLAEWSIYSLIGSTLQAA